jgi:tyrosine-protein kinase Etk/Wzc
MTDTELETLPEEEQEIKLLELVQVLVQRKMLIIKICTVSVVAAAIYSMTLPNIYSATARVLPPQKETGGGLSAMLGQFGGVAGLAGGGLGGAGNSDLYLGILKSRSVTDAVIQQLDLAKVFRAPSLEVARRRLEGSLKLQAGKDGIIAITIEDPDPKRAAAIANSYVEELGKTTVRLNLSKAGTERSFLEKRLELVKADLKAAEEDLKNFSQRNKIFQLDAQSKASIESLARVKSDLAKYEVQLSVLSASRTEQSPEVQAARSAIKRLKGELSALGGSGAGEGIPTAGSMPGVGLEYARKLREFKAQEAIFEQLSKQHEVAKLNEAKDSSTLQTLDVAVPSVYKSKPSRSGIVIASAFASFAFSFVLVLLLDYLNKAPVEDKKTLENIKRHLFSFR